MKRWYGVLDSVLNYEVKTAGTKNGDQDIRSSDESSRTEDKPPNGTRRLLNEPDKAKKKEKFMKRFKAKYKRLSEKRKREL